MRLMLFARSLCLLLLLPLPAMACGPGSDCRVENGTYRIRLPDGRSAGERIGAIVFAHGYRGSARGTMRNAGLTSLAQDLGVALIALKSFDDDWTIPNAPSAGRRPERDEVAYVARVVEDATGRFGLDPDRLLASGFSAGGMMVWTLACQDSTRFAGFVPLSGTFWAPVPARCPSPPANLIHYHGTRDKVVPLAGRPIGPTSQSDVRLAISMYRQRGGFAKPVESTGVPRGLSCSGHRNARGKLLELCTFPGGHGFRSAYIRRAWHLLVPGKG